MARVLERPLGPLPFAGLARWLAGRSDPGKQDLIRVRDAELMRLQATSPHLLDDIGMAGRAPTPPRPRPAPVRGQSGNRAANA